MNGTVFLALTLAASLASSLAYALPLNFAKKFRAPSLTVAAICAFLASVSLMALIFQNDVSYAYVVSYSSKDLPDIYKFSAFWAGQQGSFLLWLLIHSITSIILYREKKLDNASFAVYMAIEAILTVLVLAKSPFMPQENIVEDGFGLNPLLQGPWMAVHPPIIFIGYALLAIPFSMSLGALFTKNVKIDWLETSRKWTLIAWAFLGAGIFVGGYWAYKVLGWGGYWGWDPVENSSLVPWLVAGVLLHLIKVAKIRQSALPVMHLASIFTFSLVIYGTFLTRSGLLGDFSVHSFGENNIGSTLAIVNAAVLIGGLFLLTVRTSIFSKENMYPAYRSREFLMLLGSLSLSFTAALIFLGMSMPLITNLMGQPAAVDAAFYVKTTLPLAILFSVTMFLAVLYLYGEGNKIGRTFLPLVLGVIFTAFSLFIGIRDVLPLILTFVSGMSGAAALYAYRKKALSIGGAIAHFGVALAFLGIALSSGGGDVTEKFEAGETKNIFGYNITYEGQEFLADNSAKFYAYNIDGNSVKALTKLRSNGSDSAREPAILKTAAGDVYIAPSPPEDMNIGSLTLKQWEIALDGELAYIFENVEVTEPDNNHILAVANISVTDGTNDEVVAPSILVSQTSGVSEPVEILNGKKQIRLTGVSENRKKIRIEIIPSKKDMAKVPITAHISEKPFIWLLWLGAVLVTIGILTALTTRRS